MNTRQWELYELIKESSSYGEWINTKQIYLYMHCYPKPKENKHFAYSSAHRMIIKDIHTINEDETIQKIIISNTAKGYRLATENEMDKYFEKKKIDALKRLKYVTKLMKKASLNHQKRLTFTEYERDEIQSLLGELK